MEIHITGKNIQVTEPLKKYTEEKASRLNKFLHGSIDANVILSVEKFRQKAEVTINANNLRVHGTEESENMYASIDKVMDKILAQVKKHKEKNTRSKGKDSIKTEPLELNEAG